jgi:hypothetical protein
MDCISSAFFASMNMIDFLFLLFFVSLIGFEPRLFSPNRLPISSPSSSSDSLTESDNESYDEYEEFDNTTSTTLLSFSKSAFSPLFMDSTLLLILLP